MSLLFATHALSGAASDRNTVSQVREDLQRLGFEHQQDHKVLMLDSAQASADNCRCTELACTDYDQAIIFDHDVRRT